MYQLSEEKHQPKKLRHYQKNAIQSVLEVIQKDCKSVALIMPTGAGKSLTIAQMMANLGVTPSDTIALVPRRKLKRQLRHEFKLNGLSPQIVHTAQSVTDTKLFEKHLWHNLKYIILDECHELGWWEPIEKLKSVNPDAVIIGLTATPDRLSKKQFFEDKFDRIIYPITFGELVYEGYLCNPRYFSYGNKLRFDEVGVDAEGGFIQEQLDRQCEKKHFNENIVRNLIENNLQDRRSIVFCSSVKQSKQLTQMLCDAGISAIHVDGSTSESQQELAISKVANGEISALCCAKLLIAGFDEPRIDTVVLATATNSPMALVQMCGRGSRPHSDKYGEFWVFDFGDNFARLRIGLKQRFPYKTKDNSRDEQKAPMKACPECGSLNYAFVQVCKDCGAIFPKKDKPVQDLQDMDIVEVEADLADIYHIKQTRKMFRSAYANNELPFIDIARYCVDRKLQLHHVVNASTLIGAIFKRKSLENLLDLMWYCDSHLTRIEHKNFGQKEAQWFKAATKRYKDAKKVDAVIKNWKALLVSLPALEFGQKYTTSKSISKYIGKGRWQDVLGVLDFDSKENMIAAYKRKWAEINSKLDEYVQLPDGQFDPDKLIELLDGSNDKVLLNLKNQILVIEWAYKYVNLLHK